MKGECGNSGQASATRTLPVRLSECKRMFGTAQYPRFRTIGNGREIPLRGEVLSGRLPLSFNRTLKAPDSSRSVAGNSGGHGPRFGQQGGRNPASTLRRPAHPPHCRFGGTGRSARTREYPRTLPFARIRSPSIRSIQFIQLDGVYDDDKRDPAHEPSP